MSNYGDILAGLKTVLQNNITGLKVYDYPVDSIHQYPSAVILPEPIDTEIALQGNSVTFNLRVVFLICSGEASEGFLQLYDYIDPTVANKSVVKAVRADRTLNGKADDSDVVRIEKIGRREVGGGAQYGFDAIVEVIKSVA